MVSGNHIKEQENDLRKIMRKALYTFHLKALFGPCGKHNMTEQQTAQSHTSDTNEDGTKSVFYCDSVECN